LALLVSVGSDCSAEDACVQHYDRRLQQRPLQLLPSLFDAVLYKS